MANLFSALLSARRQKQTQSNADRRFQESQRENALERGRRNQLLDLAQKKFQYDQQNIPSAETGRATLAQESLRNIPLLRQDLYPDGTPQSFKRFSGAAASNIPFAETPFIGEIIPGAIGERGQNVARHLQGVKAAKSLIQTGVASNVGERAGLETAFGLNAFTSAPAYYKALDELERFNKDYLKAVDPTGSKGLLPKEQFSQQEIDAEIRRRRLR